MHADHLQKYEELEEKYELITKSNDRKTKEISKVNKPKLTERGKSPPPVGT